METETEIQQFYRDKNVFITGGTGFLGKVFIEKLLRSTEVNCIYMLIRPKRGKNIDERIEDIFKDPLFDELKKLKSNAVKHITPIIGDCVLPQLGISSEDRSTLIDHVDVVVHSAATVRFNEPISNALAINVRATRDLLQLAKKMTKLKAYVHVSSAFANCQEQHIKERYYAERLCNTAENVCNMSNIMGQEFMNRISAELCRGFPNTYCYTKALAEEAVLREGNELPICIFRPSIVVPTCQAPVKGWIDNMYGPTSILLGAGYGVLRVMYMRMNSNASIVPVDYCANAMLVCAWNTAKEVRQVPISVPPIYNLAPDERNTLKWAGYRQAVETYGLKIPMTKMIWFPFLIATDSKLFYKFLCFFYHTIPGYIFDFLLLLLGRKRRMVKTYRKIHRDTAMLDYFVEHNWSFSMDNTKQLWQSLAAKDQELFQFNMLAVDWQQYMNDSLIGMRRFLAKEDPSTVPKGLKLVNRLLILHRAVQLIVYGGGLTLLLWILVRIWQWL